jgi:hypothetical protein
MAAHPSQLTTLNNSYMHSFTASPMLGSPVSSGTAFGPTVTLQAASSGSPCSTLFVANLGTFCSEQELKELFARCILVAYYSYCDYCIIICRQLALVVQQFRNH